jgi:uncharacterized repeat protein (TIGR01451 family)
MRVPPVGNRTRRAAGAMPPGRPRRGMAAVTAGALSLLAVSLLPGSVQAGTVQASATAPRATAPTRSPASASTSAELVIPPVPAAGISGFAGSWGTSETGPAGGLHESAFPDPDGVLRYLSAATHTSVTSGVIAPPVWSARADIVYVKGPSLRPDGPPLLTVYEAHNYAQCNPPHLPLASTQLTPPGVVAFGKALPEGKPLELDLTGEQLGLPDVSYGAISFLLTRTATTTGVTVAAARTSITIDGTLYNAGRALIYSGPLAALTLSDVVADCAPAPIEANVRIIKDAPAAVEADGTVTYTLTAVNDGPGDAKDVVVSDELRGQLHDVAGLPSACSLTGGTVRCSLGTMAVGETREISFTARVKPSAAGGAEIENCGTVTTTTPETDYDDNADCVSTLVLQPPTNLSVTASAPPTAKPGDSIDYEFPVINHGPTDAEDTVVVIELSDELSAVTRVPDGCTLSDRTLICDIGHFPAGASKTYVVTGTVAGTATDGTSFKGCATVTTSTPETSYLDNVDCAPTIVAVPPPSADLAIVKTGPASVATGDAAAYLLTVTNHGPDPAADATVTDVIPAGLAVASAPVGCTLAGRTLTCDLGTLAVDATRTITVDATVSAPAGSAITNCASVTATTRDTSLANNHSCALTEVPGAPEPPSTDLAIVKTGTATTLPGGAVSYTLTVTNHGPDHAEAATVTDVMPVGLTLTRVPAGCTLAGRTLTCDLGTLTSGATRIITLDARVSGDAGTAIENCATAETSTPDSDLANNASCAQTEIEQPPPAIEADLAVFKTGPGVARPGDTLRYTFTVTSFGPDKAVDATVTDVLAESLTVLAAPPGCSVSGRTVTCDVGTMAVGESKPITLLTRLARDAQPGTLTGNCATAASPTHDPDLANGASCAQTIVIRPLPDPDVDLPAFQDADLAIVKTGPASVRRGDEISYTLTVVNRGPEAAGDTVIGDVLPDELFGTAVPVGCTLDGQLLGCRLGTLQPGATRTFTLTGTLAVNAVPDSEVENCAVTYTTTAESTLTSNASCAHTQVQPGPPTVPVTG